MAAFRFRSCRAPQSGQVQVGSRFRLVLTAPQALQVLLLWNHMGARMTPGVAPLGPCRPAAASRRPSRRRPGREGVCPRINPATFRSSMTRSLNFRVTVLVIWCWALCLKPRTRRWHLSIFRWASHQPREPFCRRAWARCHLRSFRCHLVGGLGIPVGPGRRSRCPGG